jgi:Mg2+ and Co2+ transporter CorA
MTDTIDNRMIMKCVAYQNGVSIGDVTIEDISEVLKLKHTFIWLGLLEANSKLLAQIQEEFGLHDLAIEDACAAHQRPKIEEFGNSLFMVLHTAHLAGDQVKFGETHIFLGPRFLVTVRHGSSLSHSKIRARCMQVHLIFETVLQNEVVKRLAGWGAILAIPTMVFIWYGMNFRHMPELDWQYSYPLVVGGVALGSLLLYLHLKKTG